MKGLHLDPLHVFHGSDEPGNTVDIRWIVGFAGNEGEPDPDRLGERSKALPQAQRGGKIPASHAAIGVRIRALDVEQNVVNRRQVRLIRTIAQKSRRLDRRVQAHLLGPGKYSSGKGKLYHGLSARNRQTSAQVTKRRRKVAEATEYVVDRYVGAVLQVPGVRIMAVGTA